MAERGKRVLDRFTETAKQIVSDAKDLAGEYKHGDISNEHLLASILKHENSLAWKMIVETNTPHYVIQHLMNTVLVPEKNPPTRGLGFDEFMKKTIEMAFRKTEALRFTWISSALILYGIMESGSDLSARILKSWGLSSDLLVEKIKQSGDLPGSKEKVAEISSVDRNLLLLSNQFDDDLQRLISHAIELARTYKSKDVNLYHLYLSLVFLGCRKVIKIGNLDTDKFDLDKVKTSVSAILANMEKNNSERVLLAPEVVILLKTAVFEAYQLRSSMVTSLHLTMAFVSLHPDIVKDGIGLDYPTLRRLIFSDDMAIQEQQTIRTPAVNGRSASNWIAPQISLRRYNADPSAVIMIPQRLAMEWDVMALHMNGELLTVAMVNPDARDILAKLKELTGMDIAVIKTDDKDLRAAFKMYY